MVKGVAPTWNRRKVLLLMALLVLVPHRTASPYARPYSQAIRRVHFLTGAQNFMDRNHRLTDSIPTHAYDS